MTSARDPLADYARKRAFDAISEPGPQPVLGRRGPLLFVVQKHAARRVPSRSAVSIRSVDLGIGARSR